jgi:CHRD domain
MFRYTALLGGFALAYAGVAMEASVAQTGIQLAQSFRANLIGFNEVPSISTSGTGRFDAELLPDEGAISYELSYSGLENAVTQAHIHFSQPGVNGGIIVFLCTNLDNSPGTQSCPVGDGEISGTITADDVIGSVAQGLDAGAFDQLLAAMLDRATYANVHTVGHEGGEIRGEIVPQTPEVVAE